MFANARTHARSGERTAKRPFRLVVAADQFQPLLGEGRHQCAQADPGLGGNRVVVVVDVGNSIEAGRMQHCAGRTFVTISRRAAGAAYSHGQRYVGLRLETLHELGEVGGRENTRAGRASQVPASVTKST